MTAGHVPGAVDDEGVVPVPGMAGLNLEVACEMVRERRRTMTARRPFWAVLGGDLRRTWRTGR